MSIHRLLAGAGAVVAVFVAGTWVGAQVPRWTPLAEPRLFTGPDVGFRVMWMNGEVPYGQVIIRLNGRWVEAKVGEPGNFRVIPQIPEVPVTPRSPGQPRRVPLPLPDAPPQPVPNPPEK